MTTKRLFIYLISLFSLALGACSVQFTTEINADGSGDFKVRYVLSEEDIQAIEEEEGDDFEDLVFNEYGEDDLQNACEELVDDSEFPGNATAAYSEKGGEISCEILMPFDDLDELIEIYEDQFFGMTGNVAMNTNGDLTYLIELDSSVFASEDDQSFYETEYFWIVNAPGSIENNNAGQERNGTLTWDLSASELNSIEFDSVRAGLFSGLSGNLSPYWLLALACLCLGGFTLVFIGAIAFYIYSQNKRNSEEI